MLDSLQIMGLYGLYRIFNKERRVAPIIQKGMLIFIIDFQAEGNLCLFEAGY